MDRKLLAVLLSAGITALVALSSMYIVKHVGNNEPDGAKNGLLIVVSFPSLKYEVSQLLCSGDKVYVIASSAVDPHDYQLTVDDINRVKRADLVVTLGHAPFEVKLRTLVGKDRLLEIPSIKGIKILSNPDTGTANLHMVIYDPHNYIMFVKEVAARLAALRPSCSSHYLDKASALEAEIIKFIHKAPRIHVKAVASLPYIQYAVDWLGVDIVKLLSKEHGVPVSPEDLQLVRDLIESRVVAVAVVSVYDGRPATRVDAKLVELAKEYGIPVVHVPSPYAPGTIPDKLKQVVEEIETLSK
ncbi:MAG TPA: ABC transporter substrate-binding protein [Pyrodictium delaneyi]|uniref:ABC transporter substrate-binding protein n=1 Tax=Pyrodictium delaneyi TaxID=1273541 RepID=A0A832ZT33_9CREN|nr:ABC transporter substrate-binding protein [Pyrodictium delaneyi]